MTVQHSTYELEFKHPFGVSSNTRTRTTSVFVAVLYGHYRGFGEACIPAYLGENLADTLDFVNKAADFLSQYDPVLPLHFFLDAIDQLEPGHNAAKAALDIALHDLYGKIQQLSYAQMMGIESVPPVNTAFTIGIDEPARLKQKIEEAADFELLKIKAGTADDKALIREIRKHTDKPLYVDVNQGWKEKEKVLDMLFWLKEQGVVLVEQPMPVAMKSEMQWVTQRSSMPTIADESVKRLDDLLQLGGSYSGINIKLMKSAGLREAMRMIQYCRKNNLKILLGCMAESSCGTCAMSQLLPFADFVDLDAPLLYKNDPFTGMQYEKGKVKMAKGAGIGVVLKEEMF